MKKYYFFASLLSLILLAFLTLTMTKVIFRLSFIINSLLLVIWALAVILFHRTLVRLKKLLASKIFYLLDYFYVMVQVLLAIALGAWRLSTSNYPKGYSYRNLLFASIIDPRRNHDIPNYSSYLGL